MSLGEHVQAWAIGVLLVAGKCHVVTSVKLMKIETPKEQSDIQTSLQVSKKRLYYASNIVTFIEKGNFGDTMCETAMSKRTKYMPSSRIHLNILVRYCLAFPFSLSQEGHKMR